MTARDSNLPTALFDAQSFQDSLATGNAISCCKDARKTSMN